MISKPERAEAQKYITRLLFLTVRTGSPKTITIRIIAGNFSLTGVIIVGPNISIYGGFNGTENRLNERVQGSKSELTMSTESESIINVSSSRGIVIDGLTFKGVSGTGHAVHVENGGSITFNNCIFTGNNSTENGGAIYSTAPIPDKSTVIIADCIFTGNSSGMTG